MADKHWFHSKTPAAKKAYIAAHPNSIYAKQLRVARGDAQREKTAKVNRAAHNANIKARRDAKTAKIEALRAEGTKLAKALESAQEKAEFHNERYQDMKAAGKSFEAEQKLYQDGVKKCREISNKIEEMRAEYKRLIK